MNDETLLAHAKNILENLRFNCACDYSIDAITKRVNDIFVDCSAQERTRAVALANEIHIQAKGNAILTFAKSSVGLTNNAINLGIKRNEVPEVIQLLKDAGLMWQLGRGRGKAFVYIHQGVIENHTKLTEALIKRNDAALGKTAKGKTVKKASVKVVDDNPAPKTQSIPEPFSASIQAYKDLQRELEEARASREILDKANKKLQEQVERLNSQLMEERLMTWQG